MSSDGSLCKGVKRGAPFVALEKEKELKLHTGRNRPKCRMSGGQAGRVLSLVWPDSRYLPDAFPRAVATGLGLGTGAKSLP